MYMSQAPFYPAIALLGLVGHGISQLSMEASKSQSKKSISTSREPDKRNARTEQLHSIRLPSQNKAVKTGSAQIGASYL